MLNIHIKSVDATSWST